MIKNIVACVTLSAAFIGSAVAGVVQTGSGSGSYDGYQAWGYHDVSTVTFAKNTNMVTSLSGSGVAYDQGWGGQWADGNHVVMSLYQGGTHLWAQHALGGGRNTFGTQFFDYTHNAAIMASLNSALSSIVWDDTSAVTMRMQANPIGWGGWALHVRNAGFSVSSDVVNVPEPTSIALLGLGLAGLVAAGRRKAKNTSARA
ncbi:PEP-CTERM sorting domain-containing protein [Massilia sp. H6]|uniref:PEP-CTERM sorting domain-containing protein n=1 Tax=Massilia sp. H6 TaxID=2970464 RepID=UPI002169D804|nr:PEP-CTERM sorting domain-containing protein [Massilia sp. H6]UVW29111.1 PEP-CTERM sorting domain-containing protein [Massilia sp. H6]